MKFIELLQLFREGKATARSHMKNLLEVAYVDGHFDESEKKLLSELARKHKVSKRQLTQIRKNPDSVEFEVPNSTKEKFIQLYDLVRMMLADEYVDHDELNLCALFAKKFGYEDSMAHDLIESIANNVQHGHSSDETMKRVHLMIV